MKKFAFTLTITLVCTLPALAQGGAAYRVDNFDFANGVRVELPPPPPAPAPAKRGKRSGRVNVNRDAEAAAMPPLTQLTSMAISESLDTFTTGNTTVDGYIVDSCKRNGVDPVLLYAIMHQESTFKQHAISPKGARGLMQLMPGTAARFGVTNIFDPRQNIEGGARYVKFLLDAFDGDVKLTLAGYNAGEGAVMKYGNRVPPYAETQEYVRRISQRYALMRDPNTARFATRPAREQLASMQGRQSAALTIYERSIFAIRLPDGRLQLINQ